MRAVWVSLPFRFTILRGAVLAGNCATWVLGPRWHLKQQTHAPSFFIQVNFDVLLVSIPLDTPTTVAPSLAHIICASVPSLLLPSFSSFLWSCSDRYLYAWACL
ncbi:unnamed protein product [Lota lota]